MSPASTWEGFEDHGYFHGLDQSLRVRPPLAGVVTIPPWREQQEIASYKTSSHHACCDLFDGFDRHGDHASDGGTGLGLERILMSQSQPLVALSQRLLTVVKLTKRWLGSSRVQFAPGHATGARALWRRPCPPSL